jgi:hypothetical protein
MRFRGGIGVEWSAERFSHGTIFRQSKSNDRFILDLINIYVPGISFADCSSIILCACWRTVIKRSSSIKYHGLGRASGLHGISGGAWGS